MYSDNMAPSEGCRNGSASGTSQRGFTLIELMMVLIIVAILAMVAAPAYQTLTERTRLKSYANELVASVYLARSEAIKRNRVMTMCVSDDGDDCTGGGDWEEGWVVLDRTDPSDPVVIKYQQALASGLILFEQSSVSFTSMDFQPSGIASTSASMKLCREAPTVGTEEKIVTVTVTGRPRIETTTVGCP